MPRSSVIHWTAKQCMKKVKSGEFNFDNAVQRGCVWDISRKSLWIHSMILSWVRTEPLTMMRTEKGYDVINGKQRLTTIPAFVNDEFVLKNIPETDPDGQPFVDGNGTVLHAEDLEGKKFSELPQEWQDAILDYDFQVYCYEDITEGQNQELFFRINNGKALTSTEITRVKAKSKKQIAKLSEHPVFPEILTVAGLNRYTDETIIFQIYSLLFSDEPNFSIGKMRPLMANAEITDEQMAEITAVLDKYKMIYDTVKANEEDEGGAEDVKAICKKVRKRIASRTHLVSMTDVIKYAIENDIPDWVLPKWCIHFFNGGTVGTTISLDYNRFAVSGSSGGVAIGKRKEYMMRDFTAYAEHAVGATENTEENRVEHHEDQVESSADQAE